MADTVIELTSPTERFRDYLYREFPLPSSRAGMLAAGYIATCKQLGMTDNEILEAFRKCLTKINRQIIGGLNRP